MAVCLAGVAPAEAGSESCSTVVFDGAGVLADNRSVVDTAARGLEQLGAVVRVRAMERVPGGDIDAWMRAEEQRCPDWLGANGLRRTNLLVMAVATEDRKTGLWYGEQWRPALDGRWHGIQVDFMNPLFQQGRFGSGLAAGLGALAGEIASPAAGGGPPRATTTTVYRDAARRPVGPDGPAYVAEPEYPGYGEPSWDGGGDGMGPRTGFVVLMVLVGAASLATAVFRAGGTGASGRSGWFGGGGAGMFSTHGHHTHSGPSDSGSFGGTSGSGGGGSFGGGGSSGSSGSSGGGGGGSTSW